MSTPLAQARPTVSEAERRLFFHLSQGSDFVPVCAIRIHERERGTSGPNAVADYFARYGLIPDPVADEHNPLGLPIGVTLTEGRTMAGFNCAACHVAKVPDDASGQILVGAPGHFDIRRFYDELIPWLAPMLADRKQSAKVLGCMIADSLEHALASAQHERGHEARDAAEALAALDEQEKQATREVAALGIEDESTDGSLRSAAKASGHFRALSLSKQANVVRSMLRALSNQARLLAARRQSLGIVVEVGAIPHTEPGPGRVDVFMTALNLLQRTTDLPMTSPVGYPPLWGTHTLRWLHYDGNTDAALERNMGQSIGVGGVMVPSKSSPGKIDATTVNPENLVKLESVLAHLSPPRWPFDANDAQLVELGRTVYVREGCPRCHDPDASGVLPELPFGPLDAKDDPKTDPNRLDNFDRLVAGTPALEFLRQKLDALAGAVPQELRDKSDASWRATHRYAPRALAGVWATAPYLHNNSVPTLWDLFSTDRPASFRIDYSRYDTKKVGYALAASGGAEFRTSEPGNGNQGHPWGTQLNPGNDDAEKRALIAYLKQL